MSRFIIEGGTLHQGTQDPSTISDGDNTADEEQAGKSRSILGTAIRCLPDIRNFRIKLGG